MLPSLPRPAHPLTSLLPPPTRQRHPVCSQVEEAERDDAIKVAIVGRPNVGKSSLLNRLYGQERSIVSDIAGTTRDAVDALVEVEGTAYRFIDTAGIRRRKKVEYGNEYLMVNRALKAIRRADVVLLVVDVVAGINDQDKILAQRVAEDGRACVVIANKWDAVEKDDKTYNEAVAYVKEELFAVTWAEVRGRGEGGWLLLCVCARTWLLRCACADEGGRRPSFTPLPPSFLTTIPAALPPPCMYVHRCSSPRR